MRAHSGPEAPMKILHVFRAPLGGLFRQVRDLSQAQAERGHDVGIFCDSTTGGARADQAFAELSGALRLGLTRVPISRNPAISDVSAMRALAAMVAETGADVVHGHGSKGGFHARFPRVLSSRGAVRAYTPHGGSLNYFPNSVLHRFYMVTERLLERGTDVFLFESRFVAERYSHYVGATKKPVRIVVNGLHPDEFVPVSRGAIEHELLYIGEFRFAKGIDNLLAAMKLLHGRMANGPRLLLVGSGPDEAELRRQIETLGLSPSVTILPPMAARDAFQLARIMVVPSRFESMPYVVLEAAGACMPLISTNAGGIPEIFGPEASRLIAPDDVDALARVIEAALSMSDAELGEEASRLTLSMGRTFDVATMVENVLDAYRQAIAARTTKTGP